MALGKTLPVPLPDNDEPAATETCPGRACSTEPAVCATEPTVAASKVAPLTSLLAASRRMDGGDSEPADGMPAPTGAGADASVGGCSEAREGVALRGEGDAEPEPDDDDDKPGSLARLATNAARGEANRLAVPPAATTGGVGGVCGLLQASRKRV